MCEKELCPDCGSGDFEVFGVGCSHEAFNGFHAVKDASPSVPLGAGGSESSEQDEATARMMALMGAAAEAGHKRNHGSVLRGAPSHTGADLLNALELRGWQLTRIPPILPSPVALPEKGKGGLEARIEALAASYEEHGHWMNDRNRQITRTTGNALDPDGGREYLQIAKNIRAALSKEES